VNPLLTQRFATLVATHFGFSWW